MASPASTVRPKSAIRASALFLLVSPLAVIPATGQWSEWPAVAMAAGLVGLVWSQRIDVTEDAVERRVCGVVRHRLDATTARGTFRRDAGRGLYRVLELRDGSGAGFAVMCWWWSGWQGLAARTGGDHDTGA